MRAIKFSLTGILLLIAGLWVAAEPVFFLADGYFAWRKVLVQLTGLLAMTSMSVGVLLALRPRWPEPFLGGLDKMYRLHKWLGISALSFAIAHFLLAKGTKWAVGWGWLQKPARGGGGGGGPRQGWEAALHTWKHTAESVGEWAFYGAVALILVALIKWFPYRFFFKTHRLLALAYLALAFHAIVLIRFDYWSQPIGWVMALMIVAASVAAALVLVRRVGAGRQVAGTVAGLHYFPAMKALEVDIEVPQGWPGHKPGQFAFVLSEASEGAHPFTIASAWNAKKPVITFLAKELGDYTGCLRDRLKAGQQVRLEGPYGCFTFEDGRDRQIWVAGGIGITPFMARMKQMAAQASAPRGDPACQTVDLVHATSDPDEEGLERLARDARDANIRLHVWRTRERGRLTGAHLRDLVPDWREASIWFCGPAEFGEGLRADFAAQGFDTAHGFHQELFAMR